MNNEHETVSSFPKLWDLDIHQNDYNFSTPIKVHPDYILIFVGKGSFLSVLVAQFTNFMGKRLQDLGTLFFHNSYLRNRLDTSSLAS